jgi:sec-independent protein translocase protein TatA
MVAMGLRLPEVLIILVVLVLVFGANKIPQLGDALGKGIRNFKKSSREQDDSIDVTPKAQPAEQGQLPHGKTAATPGAAQPAEKKI